MERKNDPSLPRIVVGLAIVVHKGRVLIGCRPDGVRLAGYWEFPGGKLEPGESPQACAIREAREECGLLVQVTRPLTRIVHADPDATVELLPFLCDLVSPEEAPSNPLGTANAGWRWVSINELRRYRFPAANDGLLAEIANI